MGSCYIILYIYTFFTEYLVVNDGDCVPGPNLQPLHSDFLILAIQWEENYQISVLIYEYSRNSVPLLTALLSRLSEVQDIGKILSGHGPYL